MAKYRLTGFSSQTPWDDEDARERFEAMLKMHGDVRFLGIEDGRATFKMLLDAADDDDAARRGTAALHAAFGNGYGYSGPDLIVDSELFNPFPGHPPPDTS